MIEQKAQSEHQLLPVRQKDSLNCQFFQTIVQNTPFRRMKIQASQLGIIYEPLTTIKYVTLHTSALTPAIEYVGLGLLSL
jgi:hypothetical protein